MATFVDPLRNDKLVSCPYDPVHKVRESRLMYHVTRCSKKINTPHLIECPFNAMHRVKAEEYASHLEKCPNLDETANSVESPSDPLVYQSPALPDQNGQLEFPGTQEDWDDEELTDEVRRPLHELIRFKLPEVIKKFANE